MEQQQEKIFVERRKSPDFWTKSLTWLGLAGWSLMVAALLVLGIAKPEQNTFFDRAFSVDKRLDWNMSLVNGIFVLMIIGLVVSIMGLVINSRRHRRKGDHWRISLIFLGVMSVAGIIIHIVYF